MNDIEWKEFISEIISCNCKVNLKSKCKERGVGLNTLYRKLELLKESDRDLYNEFIKQHPYSPRDISTIDFEQLMRESIIFNVSQKDMENIYGISKRTIQRKFKIIREENSELFDLYQAYLNIKDEDKKDQIREKVMENYKRQEPLDEERQLKTRREEFLNRVQQLEKENVKGTRKQAINYYKHEIQRIDNQIEFNKEENEKYKGEEK